MLRWAWVVFAAVMLSLGQRAEAQAFDAPWLTGESRPEDISISLSTFGPGDEVHQYFGHTALEVRDRRLGMAALYNFGMFSFDNSFLLKFLKGHLEFWLGVQPVTLSYDFYAGQDRDVRVMELDLPPDKAAAMAHALAVQALPENRTYLYHHYFDNCATRIVDAIDRATDGTFKRSLEEPARMSFRGHTRRYAARDPVIDWLLVFAMNDDMEQPIKRMNELFLPVELEQAVKSFRYEVNGQERPLVRRIRVLHEAKTVRTVYDTPPVTWPYTLGLGLVGGGALAQLGRRTRESQRKLARVAYGLAQVGFGLVFGLLGIAVTTLSLFTEHRVTYMNENLFFANPLTFGLLVTGFGVALGRPWAQRASFVLWSGLAALAACGVVLKVLPAFNQDNTLVWTLLGPIAWMGFWGASLSRKTSARDVLGAKTLATPGA